MSIKKLQVNTANIRKKLAGVSVPLPGIRNELGVGYRLDGCNPTGIRNELGVCYRLDG